jgi:hypothetical protein
MLNVVLLSVDLLHTYKISVIGWVLWRHNISLKSVIKRYLRIVASVEYNNKFLKDLAAVKQPKQSAVNKGRQKTAWRLTLCLVS